MTKNILKWNFPPGTTSNTYDIDEYRRTQRVSSAEDFKGMLQSLSGAAPVDVASLDVQNNVAISQLALLTIQEALKWVESGGAGYEHGEFADMFRAFWLGLSSLLQRPDWSPESFVPDAGRGVDPGVQKLFDREVARVRTDSFLRAIESGQLILKDTELGPYLERSLQLRRSALACLTDLAARELLPQEFQTLFDDRKVSGPT